MDEMSFEVRGLPPAKSEALAMLGAGHAHAPRVRALLEAARRALSGVEFTPFSEPIGLEVVLRSPVGKDPKGDATNYLGGIADVLQDKSHLSYHTTMKVDLPPELMQVVLYQNDKQIQEIHYRREHADEAGYSVRVWRLDH